MRKRWTRSERETCHLPGLLRASGRSDMIGLETFHTLPTSPGRGEGSPKSLWVSIQ